jgi:hypothetical protein
VDEPVKSDIPTLLLSGGFDPITPASYAQEVASTLSHSYSFVFPAGGHGQLLEGDCPEGIAQAFLANPNQPPDASCIQLHPAPEFYTHKTVVAMPDLLKALNLDPSAAVRFLLLIFGALFLLTAFLVFPIAWLANRISRKPAAAAPGHSPTAAIHSSENDLAAADQTPGETAYMPSPAAAPVVSAEPHAPSIWRRMSSWIALLQAAILTVFLVALTVVIVQMVNSNDNHLFYGLGAEARPWFLLPLVFGLLSLVMLAIMVMLWAHREGSLARRLYYSLLAITALVCTLVMGSLGMLTGLF